MTKKLRSIAIYLPQFHPIKENDEWGGKGFTEWRNVVKGKQIIKGQYQPHIPSDLGFYDLRVPEVMESQVEMAKNYGIYGFCFYHYWFNGKRLLEMPVNNLLESQKIDFPFCLCWANENWSRNWDGRTKNILIAQDYNSEDDINHMNYLCKHVFSDDRYIKVDGKPLFIVYRPSLLPDPNRTFEIWRQIARKHGFDDLYLGFFWSFEANINPKKYGLDFAAQFPPNQIPIRTKRSYLGHALNKLGIKIGKRQKNLVYEYKNLSEYCSKAEFPDDYLLYPTITPMWDNYVRRRNGGSRIYLNSNPNLYKNWLTNICQKFNPPSEEENFVFINAWNEWAEGNHLEPCEKWGHQYLEATHSVVKHYK
jgi:lipopolysaccharide biosynthesis protein